MKRHYDMTSLPPSGIYKKGTLKYEQLVSIVQKQTKGKSGAIATYIGLVKSPGIDDRKVHELEIEAYPTYSDKMLTKICADIEKKYRVETAAIYHFEGHFEVGEILVMVIVAGRSRQNVFPALEEAIHRYKTEPAIWKKEIYSDGTTKWVNK